MLDEEYITKAQFDEAANAPVSAKKHGAEIEVDAPYLGDTIYNEMVEIYGKEEAETGGYQVFATATSDLQLLLSVRWFEIFMTMMSVMAIKAPLATYEYS